MNALSLLLLFAQLPSTETTSPQPPSTALPTTGTPDAGTTAVPTPAPLPAAPLRQFSLHGFRSPSMGVELREGFLALHVGAFPLIVDSAPEGGPRTTWFLKTGVTAYFLQHDFGSGRPSGLFFSASLVQGLNNDWNAASSVTGGTGVHGELGLVWAAWRGLDLRIGIGALLGFDGRLNVHPTPGLSWSTVL